MFGRSNLISKLDFAISHIALLIAILSVIQLCTYTEDVHDCSNMAAEQYMILSSLGFDVDICTGRISPCYFEEPYQHAWVSVNGFEYDSVTLLPCCISNLVEDVSDKHIYDTIEDAKENSFDGDFDTNFNAYRLW